MVNAITNKVLIMILLDRVRTFYEESILAFQFGFRQNKATSDAIFVTRQIIQKYIQEIYGCFIDIKAAYDHVPRKLLWKLMRIRLGPENEKIVDIFEKLYSKTTAKLPGSKETINVEIGFRQGGAESCMLFNFWMDSIIRIIQYKISQKFPRGTGIAHSYNISNECTNRRQVDESGPRNGNATTDFILYADDLFVPATSKNELQGVIEIINDTFLDFGMKLSESKTKTMSWNTNSEVKSSKSLIRINDKNIENVNDFRYLGHWITDCEVNEKYLQQQINSAYAKWHEFKDVFKDKSIYLFTRVKMAESMIRSRLVYGIETERLKKKQKIKLDAIWMRFLRRMMKGGFARKENSFGYKYTNEKVLKICKTQDASKFCQIRHCKFLAHVTRSPNNTPQKQWLFTDLQGQRCQWKPLAKDLGIDVLQLKSTLNNKYRQHLMKTATHSDFFKIFFHSFFTTMSANLLDTYLKTLSKTFKTTLNFKKC